MGFSRKDNAKKLLTRHFEQGMAFVMTAPPIGGAVLDSSTAPREAGSISVNNRASLANTHGGGHNKDTIRMTVSTFKKFCMKASYAPSYTASVRYAIRFHICNNGQLYCPVTRADAYIRTRCCTGQLRKS